MKTFQCLMGIALVLPLLLAGCDTTADAPSPKDAVADKEHDIKGKVTAIAEDKTGVTLDHEEIPGLMKGMEMKFEVKDPAILDGVAVGDQVQGKLMVKEGRYTITQLTKQ